VGVLLISDGTVVTLGETNRVLHGHDVLVEDGMVRRIAAHGEIAAEGARVIDARGMLVMPGFINAHMHFYSTFARGLSKAAPSRNFVEVLEHLWWRLDKALTLEDVYLSALVSLIDAVKHGTTTLIDHHASPHAARGSLDALSRAVRETGLRACLCYEVSDRDGAKIADEGLAENVEFIRACRTRHDSRLASLFGLHASFTLSESTLEKAARLGRELGTGFHVHLAEAASDQEHCLAEHGCRVVERFHRAGVLGPHTLVAHGVHLDGREVELLAASGTAVVHNPQSNMNNAVGVADVPCLLAGGVLVGLGTDAMTVDMREELRVALWVRHLAARDPSVGFVETTSLLVDGNRRIADRIWPGSGLGELREGGVADIVLLDYAPPTPLDEGSFLGHLVFGLPHAAVDTTIVGGRVLMEGKRLLLDLDESEVASRAQEHAAALWRRF